MFRRDNIKLIVIATVCLLVGLSAPAIGHGVQHARFAHNADRVDGQHARQIGVNDLQFARSTTARNSESPKSATATCPRDTILVGTAFDITGGTSGVSPGDEQTDVAVRSVLPLGNDAVVVQAFEVNATLADWDVRATAICARAP